MFKKLIPALLLLSVCLTPAIGAFVHPGIYHNANDLAFMRQNIAAKAQPWFGAWQKMQGECPL